MYSLGSAGCFNLTLAKWRNLKKLIISNMIVYEGQNEIGDKGCKHLSKGKWDLLTHLELGLFNVYQD
jgi:hypothetical protein